MRRALWVAVGSTLGTAVAWAVSDNVVVRYIASGAVITSWVISGAMAYCFRQARDEGIELRASAIVLCSRWFGTELPLDALRAGEAFLVDLGSSGAFRPRWRTYGIGLPGYLAGRFTLRKGENSLVLLTTGARTLYLPTTRGFSLLVSCERPDELLQRLRSAST